MSDKKIINTGFNYESSKKFKEKLFLILKNISQEMNIFSDIEVETVNILNDKFEYKVMFL